MGRHKRQRRKPRKIEKKSSIKGRIEAERKRESIIGSLIIVSLIIIAIAGGWYLLQPKSQGESPPIPKEEIISEQGIHWHADLSIKILGNYQDSPAGIGFGSIHTHEADGVIHMEYTGLVKKDDVRLSRFFENWGKKFNKDCIFDKCNGPEGNVKMFTNGEPNDEFENYIMRDGDKIEIVFEQ